MHALAIATIKAELPPTIGPLENVEFKSLDLKASKTEIFRTSISYILCNVSYELIVPFLSDASFSHGHA